MTMRSSVIGGLIAATLIFVAGLGWYALRVDLRRGDRTSRAILRRLEERNNHFSLLSQKMGATTRALVGMRADLVQAIGGLSARLTALSPQALATVESEATDEEWRHEDTQDEDTQDLPALPRGVAPGFLLSNFRKSANMSEIVNNPAVNPNGREPDSLEAIMILRELVRANAQIDMLRADEQVRVAEARVVLAAESEYIDYAPGERYERAEDALTLGEKTEDGSIRMYYMYADEFPELHELHAAQKTVAEHALRKIVRILQ